MHYPVNEGEYMKINGDPEELGIWNTKGLGPIKM